MKGTFLPVVYILCVLACTSLFIRGQTEAPRQARGTPGDSVHEAKAVSLVLPEHPARARGIKGTVQVRVNVDKKGEVTAALAVSGPAIFYEAAEQAARKSKFERGPGGFRLAYTFDDHINEKCSDHEVQIFNVRERHADNVWDLLTTSRGVKSVSLVARLQIEFLDTGEIGHVEIVSQSSAGHEGTLRALADRIAFIPACSGAQRVTTTRLVDFDEYGFRLRSK